MKIGVFRELGEHSSSMACFVKFPKGISLELNVGKLIDMSGKIWGRWVVSRDIPPKKNKHGKWMWWSTCECGTQRWVLGVHLRSGATKSCGCIRSEIVSERSTIHGMVYTLEHSSWSNAKNRTTNPKHPQWKDYGGRGIKMCSRWLNSFANFFADMSLKPGPNYSIDRIDNDGDYEPSNCRWANRKEQASNKRSNVMIKELTMTQYCDKLDINYASFRQYYRVKGLSLEESTRKSRKLGDLPYRGIMLGDLTMSQYCRKHGLTYKSFSYYYRVKELAVEEATRKAKRI